MRIIHAYSPNQALHEGLYHLFYQGIAEESRAGLVIVSREPVMTIYHDPAARVLCGETRDANPFFHLFEALWMLAGRNDLKIPKTFVSTFGQFSDDGVTLNGAYGHRWRNHFGCDQLAMIIDELKTNPKSRRCVLQMWDAHELVHTGGSDLFKAMNGSADVPCNTAAYFDTIGGKLNMTVTCRSNDIILGAYGANIVHMSILLEYVSLATGIPMGVYRQFSNNYHAYDSQLKLENFQDYANAVVNECVYLEPTGHGIRGKLEPRVGVLQRRFPLWTALDGKLAFDEDVSAFMEWVDGWDVVGGKQGPWEAQQSEFFKHVVAPMACAWLDWKNKDLYGAMEHVEKIKATDWRRGAFDFVSRRMKGKKV
jgi:hypothetical protein